MSILCKLFGHRPNRGYYHNEGGGYFELGSLGYDGAGRAHHYDVFCNCERCGIRYKVGMVPIPKPDDVIEELCRMLCGHCYRGEPYRPVSGYKFHFTKTDPYSTPCSAEPLRTIYDLYKERHAKP